MCVREKTSRYSVWTWEWAHYVFSYYPRVQDIYIFQYLYQYRRTIRVGFLLLVKADLVCGHYPPDVLLPWRLPAHSKWRRGHRRHLGRAHVLRHCGEEDTQLHHYDEPSHGCYSSELCFMTQTLTATPQKGDANPHTLPRQGWSFIYIKRWGLNTNQWWGKPPESLAEWGTAIQS